MKNPFEGYSLDEDDKDYCIADLLRMTKKEAEYNAWKLMTKALKDNNEDQMNRIQWIIKLLNE